MVTKFDAGPDISSEPKTGDRKVRIMQPPYLSLPAAIRVASDIYEANGGTADSNLLTRLLKNSTSSSSFSRKLQALRNYQLISSTLPPVSLTEIGLGVVAPKDEAARSSALKAAATGPAPFNRTYERLKGKLLPQDEFLSNSFAHELTVPRVVADQWVDSFKTALDAAGLLLTRSDGKTQILEGSSTPQSQPIAPAPSEGTDASASPQLSSGPVANTHPDVSSSGREEGHNTRIMLADGRLATIFIPDRLTQRDATRLKGALAGISAIIESMVEEQV